MRELTIRQPQVVHQVQNRPQQLQSEGPRDESFAVPKTSNILFRIERAGYMDDQRFLKACELREEGKLREAVEEFILLAEQTQDDVDKAGVLLNIAATFGALGELDQAEKQLNTIRNLISEIGLTPSPEALDDRIISLSIGLELEQADICRAKGDREGALTRYNALLREYVVVLKRPSLRQSYETVQTHRAFVLADLGSWTESLTVLHEAESFKQSRSEISFYLGYCSIAVEDYITAEEKLAESLRLGLPAHLEFRSHCGLGMASYRLGDYPKAKLELELGASKADADYTKQAQIWGWLAATCQKLGLTDEVERYAALARPLA
jgi:tetratricopeptide (TPR) repeat protein